MIKTVSEFLERLRQAENEALKRYDIKHALTIGAMYEGLTQSLLDRALPAKFGVDISAGFITDDSGKLSNELDCLVVTSEGAAVPHTAKRRFHIDDVVAVIQVKKNLYASDLRSGYENLLSVSQLDPARHRRGPLFKDAFQGTMRSPVPHPNGFKKLPHEIQMVYYTLGMELYFPARIILGYNGFKTQSALRDSFVKYLEDQVKPTGAARGFGVHRLPSLICCGGHSLVKANGIPFCSPIEDDGFWPVYVSTSSNPVELLLEIIWTRLVYDGKLPASVFDEDTLLQPMTRFIDARPRLGGWEYRVVDAPQALVDAPREASGWEPATLDEVQFAVLSLLCAGEEVDASDPSFLQYLELHHYTVERLAASLKATGLAVLDGSSFVLLTRECQLVVLPDGRLIAAENRAGELTRWMARELEGLRPESQRGSETGDEG